MMGVKYVKCNPLDVCKSLLEASSTHLYLLDSNDSQTIELQYMNNVLFLPIGYTAEMAASALDSH